MLIDLVEQAEGDVAALEAFLEEQGSLADDLALSGHVGALYLKVGRKRTPQTSGSGAFERGLDARFDFNDIDAYPGKVAKYVEEPGGGLWSGELSFLVPSEFEPYAHLVPSAYQDKTSASQRGQRPGLATSVQAALHCTGLRRRTTNHPQYLLYRGSTPANRWEEVVVVGGKM